MKNKLFKILYILLFIIAIFLMVFLIVKPRQKEVGYAEYKDTNDINIMSFDSVVEEKIYIENEKTFRIMFFLKKNTDYDNLNITLTDSKGNEIFNQFVKEYKTDAMFFEFSPISGNAFYMLKISDLDGDNLELATTKSNDKDYLLNDKNNMLQTVSYYRTPAYNYLWYPIFLLILLFTLFPFVWEVDTNEKKQS